MVRDLVHMTSEEIAVSAAKSVEDGNALIMYLQNTGQGARKTDSKDMDVWINEDIDD